MLFFLYITLTDAHITTESGILNLLEPGDGIMADKGFPHIEEDILGRGGFLIMPPFVTQGRQFDRKANSECYKVASVRIHVERAIQRLKMFGILQFLEYPLLKHLNKILIVTSYIVNSMGPLINDGSGDANEDQDQDQPEHQLDEESDVDDDDITFITNLRDVEQSDDNEDDVVEICVQDDCDFDVDLLLENMQ
jgi:hypothetical protein